MTSHTATISINYLQIVMHSLIPSTAETTTGILWRARLHSPPSLLTNTFRHSDQAKHSRSCLGQLLQVAKMPSQRSPTTTMPTFNCDGLFSPLLSSWLLRPSPHLCRACQGHPEDPWWWHLAVPPGMAPKPHRSCNWLYFLLTYPIPSGPLLAADFDVRCSGTPTPRHSRSCGDTASNPALLEWGLCSICTGISNKLYPHLEGFSVIYLFSPSKEKIIIGRIIHQHPFHPNIRSEFTCIWSLLHSTIEKEMLILDQWVPSSVITT